MKQHLKFDCKKVKIECSDCDQAFTREDFCLSSHKCYIEKNLGSKTLSKASLNEEKKDQILQFVEDNYGIKTLNVLSLDDNSKFKCLFDNCGHKIQPALFATSCQFWDKV